MLNYLLLCSILAIAIILGFYKTEFTILIAVLFIPLQQALTLQVFGTIRISDLIFSALFLVVSLKFVLSYFNNIQNRKLHIEHKLIYLYLFPIYTIISYLLSLILFKHQIDLGLTYLPQGSSHRILINLLAPILGLFILSVGIYSGKKGTYLFEKIIKIHAFTTLLVSIYTIIQFITLNSIGKWFLLPGDHLNYETTFAYGVRRPWGFFIEPGVLGAYLLFSLLVIAFFYKGRKNSLIIVTMVATMCSLSSTAIFALFSLIILVTFFSKKISQKYKWAAVIFILLIIIMSFKVPFMFDATIGKLTTANQSKLDRLNNTNILLQMFKHSPIIGVGLGNFGVLRNLYNGHIIAGTKNFWDLSNSFYFGLMGEQGILGIATFVSFMTVLARQVKNIINNYWLFLVPFLVVIFPSSSIFNTFYMFFFGLLIGFGMSKNSKMQQGRTIK